MVGSDPPIGSPVEKEGALVEVLDAQVRTGAGSVLIVEDDPDIRDLLTFGLAGHGWDVHSVDSGAAAMRAVARFDPDVIVLDLGLPDMDGREVLATLKADPATEWIPVVVVSAWADKEMITGVLRAGAQDFVVKPFDRQELEARLAAARRVAVKHRALAGSEREYRLLAEHTKDVVLRWGLDGGVRYASPSVEDLLGRPPAEVTELALLDLAHPDDLPRLFAPLAEALLRPGQTFRLVVRLWHADGRWVSCESVGSVTVGPDGGTEVLANLRDVTTRIAAETDLRAAEERFRTTFEEASIGIGIVAPDGRFLWVNRELARMVGYSREELLARTFAEITHPDDVDEDLALKAEALEGTIDRYKLEKRYLHADGHPVWVELNVSLVRDAYGAPLHFVSQVLDVSERHRRDAELQSAQEQLLRQALHDPLTNLPNRTLLMERLAHALARHERAPGRAGVLFLDLDRFKVVNDSVGHEAGDQLLVEVAERLVACVRPGDTVARLGGDEFVVLSEDLDGIDGLVQLAERIRGVVARPYVLDEGRFVCTASIGLAFADRQQSAQELLREADAAMYRSKDLGKDRYELFDEALRDLGQERVRTEQTLRRALEEGGVEVRYQPMIEVSTGRIIGAEALARLRVNDELLAPARFIETAEDSGLIVPLGAQVLEETARAVSRLRKEFGDDVLRSVCVNVSARQIGLPAFAALVGQVIEEHHLPAGFLCLELTETTLLEATQVTAQGLHDLKALGAALAIDDFGTGYSSLTYLRRFPVDLVKIDRSFVDGLPDEPGDTSIVTAVIWLARALGIEVVAEGVEQPAQLAFLAAHGCQQAQGYLFAEPLTEAELAALIAEG